MAKFTAYVARVFAYIGFSLLPTPGWSDSSCTLSTSPSGCPFQVQAIIQSGCWISGGSGMPVLGVLNFGTQPALSSATVNATLALSASYSLNCTPNMSLTMTVDGGQNYSSGRRVKLSSGDTLLYQLYSDAAYQNPITVNQAVAMANVGSGTSITLPVYGRMVLSGNARPGIYTDTVAVTFSW